MTDDEIADANGRAFDAGAILFREENKPVDRAWQLVCPECKYRCGRERSGAEFQGQFICSHCHHIW